MFGLCTGAKLSSEGGAGLLTDLKVLRRRSARATSCSKSLEEVRGVAATISDAVAKTAFMDWTNCEFGLKSVDVEVVVGANGRSSLFSIV
jgi:hypothetical protein